MTEFFGQSDMQAALHERPVCDNDQASVVESLHLSSSLIKHQQKAQAASRIRKDFDGKNCFDCGDPIPEGRLIVMNGDGKTVSENRSHWRTDRCTHCQEEHTRLLEARRRG